MFLTDENSEVIDIADISAESYDEEATAVSFEEVFGKISYESDCIVHYDNRY